ncbi:MAG: PKD domain-containing protein [Planctomycetota bacterium]|jgi:hypothetical protein
MKDMTKLTKLPVCLVLLAVVGIFVFAVTPTISGEDVGQITVAESVPYRAPFKPYNSHLGPGSIDIVPTSPTSVGNCIPFGNNTSYDFTGFIYRNIPAFELRPGCQFAFDLGYQNNVDIRRNIYFAVANKNPDLVPYRNNVISQGIRALGWTQVVSDSQIPQNPRGNSIQGDYELIYTSEGSFSFPGGGLIVGFGAAPPGEFRDSGCEQVLVHTDGGDASGFFYARFYYREDQTLDVLDSGTGGTGDWLGGIIIGPCAHPHQPVADADGPYSIYVGDTLTLDANDSTDPNDDIVSYMWDLDDNNSFETDAGGQAIFNVNYAYLESLGLIVNNTYTIHVQVTDSEDQSDVNDSTLTIVPKPTIEVAVDIKPGSCPNPVNVKSQGVLPIAILGTVDYDVTTIDVASLRLADVAPIRSSFEDVATPVSDINDCNCIAEGPDGYMDLTLKFETQDIVEAIGDVNHGDVRVLTLTGVLLDPPPYETPIEGADCILIRGRHKPINPADINKDGVVNTADFAIFVQNWLQTSIVDE